jgi:hypothetical protein
LVRSILCGRLKRRGLLEEALVLCGGEFGRTPAVEMVNGKPGMGRDHNCWGFSPSLGDQTAATGARFAAQIGSTTPDSVACIFPP